MHIELPEKRYYGIGEVAKAFDVNTSLIRFWEKEFDVLYDGISVGKYYADLVVDNKVIIEVKAVTELSREMMSQVINYLSISALPVGLLINFRKTSVSLRRFDNRFLKESS